MKKIITSIFVLFLVLASMPLNQVNATGTEENNEEELNEVIDESLIEDSEEKIIEDEDAGEIDSQAAVVVFDDEEIEPQRRNSSIENVTDLVDAVANAADGTVITLSDFFVPSAMTISMPNVNVTINGNGLVWKNGNIKINGSGSGSITLKEIEMNSSTFSGNFIELSHTAGKVFLNDLILKDGNGSAVLLTAACKGQTELNRVHIADMTAGSGPAVKLDDNATADLTINNSTIENNVGNASGYEAGAIASKGYTGTLLINNTVFKNNQNKAAHTGVFGGGGGAMSMHYLKGTMTIDESYFYGNRTNGSETGAQPTYDGGAIYVFDGCDGAVVNISNSTFEENVAYDDGGALMLQGTGNPGLTANIVNCTFFNNHAYGLSGSTVSGGAVQIFKNGGSSSVSANISKSTFVGNVSGGEKSVGNQSGGAISRSGAGFLAIPSVNLSSSLFLGNQVYESGGSVDNSSSYKDLSWNKTTSVNTNFVNADKGVNPSYTLKDVFGTSNPALATNYSNVKVGVNNETLKTLPIKPEGGAENGSKNSISGVDARGYNRYKDIGAIEAAHIKYDANGGEFDLSALGTFDGTKYYEKNDANKYTNYFDIGYIGQTKSLKSKTDLKVSKTNYVFAGWATTKDASEANVTGTQTLKGENITLYAVWKLPATYKVTYDANTATGNVPVDTNDYTSGSSITVLGQSDLTKENYTFTGWNTKMDGTGTTYQESETFNITEDITLFAQWKENDKFAVTYDGNGYTSGTLPVDGNEYYVNADANVLGKGTMVKDHYTFVGWNTQANGTGVMYQDGETLNITGNVTLYAQWKVESYKVTLLDEDGTMFDSVVVEYGEGVTITGIPTKASDDKYTYEFAGWVPQGAYTLDDLSFVSEDMTFVASYKATLIEKDVDGKGEEDDGNVLGEDHESDNNVELETVKDDVKGSVQTSDNTTIILWSALIAISVASLVLLVKGRKHEHH